VRNFPSSQDYVGNTQTRNCATKEIVQYYALKEREISEDEIIFPKFHPWKNNEEKPYFETV